MAELALAALFAVFIWWFSTGVVLLLNHLSRDAMRISLLVSTGVALAALLALRHTATQTTAAGYYCAFTSALLVWGWNELSFLTGWITGPRRIASPAGVTESRRFVHALGAILWHEFGLIAMGGLVLALTWGAPNQVGPATFAVLWLMRTSAKLNLFLGVRNLSEEFLPPHLAYLQSFFRRRPMNLLFPVSVSASTALLALLVAHALAPATPAADAIGAMLVATLLALAVLEHWMLVLPLDTAALWRWALRKPPAAAPLTLVEADDKLLRAH